MNKIIENIVGEIKELQKSAQKNDSKLLEQQRRLQHTVLLKKIFSVVNLGCQVLSFLGPEAKLVGLIIQTGVGIANTFMPKEKLSEIKVNPTFDKAISCVADKIRKSKENDFKALSSDLESFELEAQINSGKKNRTLTIIVSINCQTLSINLN